MYTGSASVEIFQGDRTLHTTNIRMYYALLDLVSWIDIEAEPEILDNSKSILIPPCDSRIIEFPSRFNSFSCSLTGVGCSSEVRRKTSPDCILFPRASKVEVRFRSIIVDLESRPSDADSWRLSIRRRVIVAETLC